MKNFRVVLICALLCLPLLVNAQATDTGATGGTGTDTGGQTTPSASSAYQFQRQGIFDCNQNGAYAMSVGAMSAMGGAYVPVSDAAVELNTGTLVYKECVLREVVDRESESALTGLGKQQTIAALTGRQGNAMFVVNEGGEKLGGASDPALLGLLKDGTLQNLDSSLQGAVTRALAQNYEFETGSGMAASLICPYSQSGGNLAAWRSRQVPLTFSDFYLADGSPSCDAVDAYYIARNIAGNRVSAALQYQQDMWNWGRGWYARVDANGNVVTPASVVQASYQQILDTGVQKMVNANDVGQMIGALYAGVTTQILADQGGLSGIVQSVGGQPSFLDQVAAESASGLQGAAANAALQILAASQQVESAYYQAVTAIANALAQTQTQLRIAENACWDQIIARACASPLSANHTCTASVGSCTTDPATGQQSCPTGATLTVATSTAFSDAIISAKITPLVAPTVQNVQDSQAALQLINNLIQGVTNTSSLDAQRIALQQLDSLVAAHKLHTQTNLTTVQQQQSAVADSMSSTLQTTAQTWGGSGSDGSQNIPWDGTTNPGNGWCNVNNSATIQAWQQKWK